jgi:nitrogen PTS system EIIA component
LRACHFVNSKRASQSNAGTNSSAKRTDIREIPKLRQGDFRRQEIEFQTSSTFSKSGNSGFSASIRVRLPSPRKLPYIDLMLALPRYNATMAQDDFDIDRLAAYLHMMPAAVTKLAERGKLPGRRVGGGWRFSSAEIHHWLEDRIGLSDEAGLAEMEDTLERATQPDSQSRISIAELLSEAAIEVPLGARTRTSVIAKMTDVAARTHLLWDPAKLADAVRAREEMHSTALDNGVALLHPRRPMPAILAEAVLALGITPGGIPFGSTGSLTDIFFLICSTSDHEHLRILARLSRVINDQEFLAALRAADGPAAVHWLVSERDAAIRDA